MAKIDWIQYTERATGMNHPSRPDVVNRPLRQLLQNSGISPDDDGIAVLTNLSLIDWSQISNTPITLAGYGITDAYTKTEVDSSLATKADAAVRIDTQVTTASLANNATENGTVTLGKSFELYKVVVDKHCRVRLYQTAADRTADAARPIGTAPDAGEGLITELIFDAIVGNTIRLAPRAAGENQDTPVVDTIYYAITNMSGGTATVTATFTHVVTEL